MPKKRTFFPYYFKNRRVPPTLARFLPAALGFADLYPYHMPACQAPSLRAPSQPLASCGSKPAIWGGLAAGQHIPLGPGISCLLCYLSPQSSTEEWCHGRGNHHYKAGCGGFTVRLNISGQYNHGVGKQWKRQQRGAAQQERCVLSPKLFFLLFWTKSPFATQYSHEIFIPTGPE